MGKSMRDHRANSRSHRTHNESGKNMYKRRRRGSNQLSEARENEDYFRDYDRQRTVISFENL